MVLYHGYSIWFKAYFVTTKSHFRVLKVTIYKCKSTWSMSCDNNHECLFPIVYKYLCFTHSCLFYYCMDATGDLSWQKGYQDTYQGESLSYRKYKCSLPPSCCFIAWPDSGSVSVPQKTTLEPPVQQKEYLRNFNRSGLFGWQWMTLFKVKIIYCTQYFNKKMFLFQHTCSIRVRSSESTEFKKLWARSRHN